MLKKTINSSVIKITITGNIFGEWRWRCQKVDSGLNKSVKNEDFKRIAFMLNERGGY